MADMHIGVQGIFC